MKSWRNESGTDESEGCGEDLLTLLLLLLLQIDLGCVPGLRQLLAAADPELSITPSLERLLEQGRGTRQQQAEGNTSMDEAWGIVAAALAGGDGSRGEDGGTQFIRTESQIALEA